MSRRYNEWLTKEIRNVFDADLPNHSTTPDPASRPEEPRTATGRAVVEATASDPFVPDDQKAALRDAARRTVLAIEAEARSTGAAPLDVPTRDDLAAALKQLHAGQKVWSYPVEGSDAEADWIVEWLTVHRPARLAEPDR
ncbi:MAG: hypothetical protein LC798_19805 [Chloroflexi bacterium]|nr:hypothetical protein [Chloroflexota bacterium]